MVLAAISTITLPPLVADSFGAPGQGSQPSTWVMLVLGLILIGMSSRRVTVAKARRSPGRN